MKKTLTIFLLLTGMLAASDEVYATFTVQAKQSANLAFAANGTVAEVHADVGDTVHKGEVLATLKSDDIQAALRIAQVGLTYAQKDYERLQSVKDVTDQTRLDGVTYKYENAKAKVAYKQALLDKTILKAPFDGLIVARNLEIGDTFTAMRPVAVYRLQSTHARKLILSFDQKYWKRVQKGDRFRYTVDGDSTPHEGRIVKVYPSADPRDRKMQAEVAAKDIPVGLFGEGKILLANTPE